MLNDWFSKPSREDQNDELGSLGGSPLVMLRQVTPTHVESDAGFSLKSGTKDYWIYSEGKREIFITAEGIHLGRDGWGKAVYLSALPDCWLPPNNIYAISESKRQEIATHVQDALRFLGIKFRIE